MFAPKRINSQNFDSVCFFLNVLVYSFYLLVLFIDPFVFYDLTCGVCYLI